jgi:uncharacterized membrane protein
LAILLLTGLALTLIQIGALEFAWEKLGIPHGWYFGLLLLAILGSWVNLPLFALPAVGGTSRSAPPTLLAVNVGGALVPAGLALWLLARPPEQGAALAALVVVALVGWRIARPMKGIGISVPLLVPPLTTVLAALLLAPSAPAKVAYVGGTLGALIGIDLMNLDKIRSLGAPVVSIGGAGTADGIFLTGLLAALIA